MKDNIINSGDFNSSWDYDYALAKIYYEHHGNLEIPSTFRTINGYEKAENGYNYLGRWLRYQKLAYHGLIFSCLDQEKIEKLNAIGMNWELKHNSQERNRWDKMYPLAQTYYAHYKNLDISSDFRTKNGYERDPDGEPLGALIRDLRAVYRGTTNLSLDENKVKKLNAIEMIWDLQQYRWDKMYLLAKAYYDYYGHSDIPNDFKTKNGYQSDPNGEPLGFWIRDLRSVYHGNKGGYLNEERNKKLTDIEMIWDIEQYRWNKMYLLAKAYYDHYGYLNIKVRFKTKNGYDEDATGVNLGGFVRTQRRRYMGYLRDLTDEELFLLEDIGMVWFVSRNQFYQEEIITSENKDRKQVEIHNRLRSYLYNISTQYTFSKEEINQGFMADLNGKYLVKK